MALLKKTKEHLDDPKTAKKIHGTLAVLWLAAAVPIMLFLSSSIPFVVFISVYAIVAGHWSGWDAAGAELEIERLKRKLKE